ncbi:Uncharacterised protein [Mycobacteroides abscessus subsp. abscessus]|nr:Uncharacterised protein [Mycobacteroides abscessus subsp. abscessus]
MAASKHESDSDHEARDIRIAVGHHTHPSETTGVTTLRGVPRSTAAKPTLWRGAPS